jgi:hypothetical protein
MKERLLPMALLRFRVVKMLAGQAQPKEMSINDSKILEYDSASIFSCFSPKDWKQSPCVLRNLWRKA